MGGNTAGPSQTTTTNQTQQQQTAPWAPSAGVLQSILGNIGQSPGYAETLNAQQQLANIGAAGDPYGAQRNDVATSLLGGGPDRSSTINSAYSGYLGATDPFVNQANLNPMNTPGFSDAYNTLKNDIITNTNQAAAAAGRTDSGLGQGTQERYLAQGLGGLLQNQYNINAQNYLNTAQGRFTAGGATTGMLSNLDQVRAAFQQAGLGAADAANAARTWGPSIMASSGQLPLNYLNQQAAVPFQASQAFGNTTGTNQGTQNQQSYMPTWMPIAGGILGAGGLALNAVKPPSGSANGAFINPFTGNKLFGG